MFFLFKRNLLKTDSFNLSIDHQGDQKSPKEAIDVLEKTKLQRPPLYKIVLLNDDYTPMDFVVYVLVHFFRKTEDEAERIMLDVHQKGKGVCGIYTWEVAETKVGQVLNLSKAENHPLQCKIEKE